MPICVAYKHVNQKEFYFPEANRIGIGKSRYSPSWFYQVINRRLFCREPLLTRALKNQKCSLIHAHFGPNGCLALPTAKELRLPLITTFYGFDISKNDVLRRYRSRYLKLFEKGNLFLVEGPHMKKRLIELGCPSEKILIQRIAIPVKSIPFFKRLPKRKGEKTIILFVGRFVEKKGIEYLIKAIAEVIQKRDDLELRLIGDGPLRERVDILICKCNIQKYVKQLGFQNYEKYLEELKNADIFIHPSATASDGDSEGGAPTVLLEAQASGIPVITTYHADIPNVVLPGVSAYMCKERDHLDLAEKIIYLMENQESWASMGKAGRKFVEENYDINKEIEKLEEKYESLLLD